MRATVEAKGAQEGRHEAQHVARAGAPRAGLLPDGDDAGVGVGVDDGAALAARQLVREDGAEESLVARGDVLGRRGVVDVAEQRVRREGGGEAAHGGRDVVAEE